MEFQYNQREEKKKKKVLRNLKNSNLQSVVESQPRI